MQASKAVVPPRVQQPLSPRAELQRKVLVLQPFPNGPQSEGKQGDWGGFHSAGLREYETSLGLFVRVALVSDSPTWVLLLQREFVSELRVAPQREIRRGEVFYERREYSYLSPLLHSKYLL